jgi:hypothetical protein
MSDADQHEPSEQQAAASSQQYEGEKLRTYAVVPTAGKAAEDELYAFRATTENAQPEPETPPQKPGSMPFATLALAAVVLVCVVALLFAIPMFLKSKSPAHFIDMGNRRFDPAGLGGRLIARWEGSATYQLSIDPLEPQQLDGFRAVAANPPHPLSVVIRLKDAAGLVACQREILLPAPQTAGDTVHAKVLLPSKTPGGDTVQYVAGGDGKLAEIALDGPLTCPADVYRRFAGWDFTSNFPSLADQNEWLRHEKALEEARNPHHAGAGAWGAAVQHLPAPIEGDDVITGDNPSRGTVDTSAGRVFLVIKTGTGNRAPEWQIFPAAIHFRCDKNGACVLSRANTRTTLQARLLK